MTSPLSSVRTLSPSRLWLPFCIALLLWRSLAAALELDLPLAEELALAHNLSLRSVAHQVQSAESAVREARGRLYDPTLEIYALTGVTRDRSTLTASDSEARERRFGLGLAQKLPTGAELTAGVETGRSELTTVPAAQLDPAHAAALRFTLTQPLLRGFGPRITEQELRLAAKERDISLEQLLTQATDLVAGVRFRYYETQRLHEELRYREISVGLAQRLFEENRARREAGLLPPVEVLEAEVGLRQRESLELSVRRRLLDSLDLLAELIGSQEVPELAGPPLAAATLEASEEEGLQAALAGRPELARLRLELSRRELLRRNARQQLLPALDLSATVARGGLAEDSGSAREELAEDDLESWAVGLSLSYPLGNREGRNAYLRAGFDVRAARAELAALELEVRRQIRAAVRQLEVSRQQVAVTRLARELAQERLQVLAKRRELGLATTRDLLEGEQDLALAVTELAAAMASSQNAATEYLRATGQLLPWTRESLRQSLETTLTLAPSLQAEP